MTSIVEQTSKQRQPQISQIHEKIASYVVSVSGQGPTLRVAPSLSGSHRKARLIETVYGSAVCLRAFSCGIRTKTVAQGSPWPDTETMSRCSTQPLRFCESVKSVAMLSLRAL